MTQNFVMYFIKTMIIIVSNLAFLITSLISACYLRDLLFYFCRIRLTGEKPKILMSKLIPKIIVAVFNFILSCIVLFIIITTLGWQKELARAVKTMMQMQPAFAALVIFMIVLPVVYAKKIAKSLEQDE